MKMFEISFFTLELVFTAVWLLTRLIVWKRQGRIRWKREAVLLLMYINLAVIIRFVFFPRALVDGHVQPLVFEAATAFPFRVNPVPLKHLFDCADFRDDLWKVVAAGVLISLSIEILQLPFASRMSDIDDVILNTLGVAAGYGIYAAVKCIKR